MSFFCWCCSLSRQLLYNWPTLITLPVPLGYWCVGDNAIGGPYSVTHSSQHTAKKLVLRLLVATRGIPNIAKNPPIHTLCIRKSDF